MKIWKFVIWKRCFSRLTTISEQTLTLRSARMHRENVVSMHGIYGMADGKP